MSVNWDRILIDVCTQWDFLHLHGAMPVTNREALLPRLRELFQWAQKSGTAVVSIIESHRPNEPVPEPPQYCVDGTLGQRKPAFTLLEPYFLVETDNSLSLPPDLRKNYRQLLFRKRTPEILSNPKADRFLTQSRPEEIILMGVGLERAIRNLALGLLARQKRVIVVCDACGWWSCAEADLALRQLNAKGVMLRTTAALIAEYPPPSKAQQVLVRRRGIGRRHHPDADRSARGRGRSARTTAFPAGESM